MNAAGRLSLYGAGLVVVFGAAFAAAGALVPDSVVTDWTQNSQAPHGEHDDKTSPQTPDKKGADVSGLAISASGFTIGQVHAPFEADAEGELTFQIMDAATEPVTEYETAHGKQLHLIVVRSDGSHYRHAHPTLDTATGTWSLPWAWNAAGTYRIYADFTAGGTSATLTRTVDVAGTLSPAPPTATKTSDSVDGFDVTVEGDLVAGAGSELTVTVTRDGQPVTALEPYLGAFGHLVALREGDLAYLHVHAHGDEPQPGDLAGPAVSFTAETPTAGRYLLYLDFQVDGQVHTAQFVLDAAAGASAEGSEDTDTGGHDGH